MSSHPTISVCYANEIAGISLFRDWQDRELIVMCALFACATREAQSIEEARILTSWLTDGLGTCSDMSAFVEATWEASRKGTLRDSVLGSYGGTLEEYDQGALGMLQWASEFPLVVDVSEGCVHSGSWSPSSDDMVLPIKTIVGDAYWGRADAISFEEMRDALVLGEGISFDTLLGYGSPAHSYLANPRDCFSGDGLAASMRARQHAPKKEPPLKLGLDDFGEELSTRTRACLRKAGVETLGQLAEMSLRDLARVYGITKMGIWEIDNLLDMYGLSVFER